MLICSGLGALLRSLAVRRRGGAVVADVAPKRQGFVDRAKGDEAGVAVCGGTGQDSRGWKATWMLVIAVSDELPAIHRRVLS